MEGVFEGLQRRHSGAPKHGLLKRGVTSNKITSLMNQTIREKMTVLRENSGSSVSLVSNLPTPSPPKDHRKPTFRLNSTNNVMNLKKLDINSGLIKKQQPETIPESEENDKMDSTDFDDSPNDNK